MENYNQGIVNLLFKERDYLNGDINEYGDEPANIEIYGKPKDVEDKVDKLFERTINDVKNSNDPFMKYINRPEIKNTLKNRSIKEIRKRLELYISDMRDDFNLNLSNEYSPFVDLQQSYIQNIREFNLILTKTDGSLDENNKPKVYNLSGDTAFNEIEKVINKIKEKHDEFNRTVVKFETELYLDLKRENFYNKLRSKFSDDRNLQDTDSNIQLNSPSWTNNRS